MHLTRRQCLISMTALAGNAGAAAYRPLLGAQFYIWTQHLAAQRDVSANDIEAAFAATRRAGYSRVELTNSFFSPEFRDMVAGFLKKYDHTLPAVYNAGPVHEPEPAEKTVRETLELADLVKTYGARAITFNATPKPKGQRKSDEELNIQARSLDQLGAKLRERGMRLLIHQHAPEMAEKAREWRHELRHTDPMLVRFCLDVDWVRRGGEDPMTLLREAGPRLGSLHLRNSQNGVWMESFGEGDIDYRQVAAYLRGIGFDGYLWVELAYEKETKITRSLEEDLRMSRTFAEKIFL